MGAKTAISWTATWSEPLQKWIAGASWNWIRGCSREIAEGAKTSGCGDQTGGGCYAERTAGRFCGEGLAYEGLVRITAKGARWTGKVDIIAKHLLDPLRWRGPRKIFVASVSDPFHQKLSNEVIAAGFGIMAVGWWHTYQSLTKRAKRKAEWFAWIAKDAASAGVSIVERCLQHAVDLVDKLIPKQLALLEKRIAAFREASEAEGSELGRWPLDNYWAGVSAEHQPAWDERVPELLKVPAVVRFVSVEPMIGPVVADLRHFVGQGAIASFRSAGGRDGSGLPSHLQPPPAINWIIAGCESGPGARACDVEWLRALRDQCAKFGVAFFLKQAEESTDCGDDRLLEPTDDDSISFDEGSRMKPRRPGGNHILELPYLDGAQHAAFPEPWR